MATRKTSKKKAKKTPRKTSKKSEISFTLQRLMNEHPCSDGLIEALRYLRENRSVSAPRKLWRLIDKLEALNDWSNDDYEDDERSVRREIRKIADDVKIIVKPHVFAERLVEGGEFYEYVAKLLKSRARKEFLNRSYELMKENLIIEQDDDIENQITNAVRNVEYAKNQATEYERYMKQYQKQQKDAEKALETLKKEREKFKSNPPPPKYVSKREFDPNSIILEGYEGMTGKDVDEDTRFAIAEEMARALAV